MTTSAEQFSLQEIASNLSAHPARDSNNSNSLTIIGSVHSAGDPNISTEKTISGDLSTSGSVRLDGVIEGNIYCWFYCSRAGAYTGSKAVSSGDQHQNPQSSDRN